MPEGLTIQVGFNLMRLEFDPTTGAQATTSWTLEFALGAELSNVSFQIRVNGSDGLMIEEPMMVISDVGLNLLDWRGLGIPRRFCWCQIHIPSNESKQRLWRNLDSTL